LQFNDSKIQLSVLPPTPKGESKAPFKGLGALVMFVCKSKTELKKRLGDSEKTPVRLEKDYLCIDYQ